MSLDKALRAARRAIELQPEDSRPICAVRRAVQSRDLTSAFAAADMAHELNKYDMLALGEWRTIDPDW
jgi:hypothetical protein